MTHSEPHPHDGNQEKDKTGRGFGGLRVVTFESRMAAETARLVHNAGGVAISAPSMKEVPLAANDAALAFADSLLAAKIDIVVFLTGVGARALLDAWQARGDRDQVLAALARTTIVARGPKPVQALREVGLPVTITVAEPNTWREILATLDEAAESVDLAGARVAIQEYGIPSDELARGLEARGAVVTRVEVYRWALPDDLAPLQDAIRQVLARTADVLLFTSSTQVLHLFEVARRLGVEDGLRSAVAEVVIGSVGPVCSETLAEQGLSVDFEPSHPKLGTLIKEASALAPALIVERRARMRTSRVSPATVRAAATHDGSAAAALQGSVFLKACRREPVPHTPVWLMRQAGRYMQEYRELRARASFIELCKTPELAAQAAVEAQQRIGADAAILFSDILLILEPMGLGLEYVHGDGPSLSRLVRGPGDVDRLREIDPAAELSFVMDALRRTRAELAPSVPLIGFSGAPFTLASYVIEGGGSRNYIQTKRFMYADKGAWDAMMDRLARAVGAYLRAQIDAGAQAVQLFDSWVGCLSPSDYATYVAPHMKTIAACIGASVPLISFGTDTATLLDQQVEAGCSVIGIDHRVAIAPVFDRFAGVAVQGNLDPVLLFADRDTIRRQCARVLDEVGGRAGHIFNLGHGILPGTPVDNVIALVDAVHELSQRN
ncbi:MAG TPA: uroporphyrinogen decarboxylase [Candidatus Binatia bacterium]|jgi:uroporphyrinogen decarboxylase